MLSIYEQHLNKCYLLSKMVVISLNHLPYIVNFKICFLHYNHKFFCNALLFYIILLLHFNNSYFRNMYIYGKTVYISIFNAYRYTIYLFIFDFLYKIIPLINKFLWKYFSVITMRKLLIYVFDVSNFPIFYEIDCLSDSTLFLNRIKLQAYFITKGINKYHCNSIVSLAKIPVFVPI